MLADFLTVHLCMIAALALSVLSRRLLPHAPPPATRLAEAFQWYTSEFAFLSVLFPAVYLLSGFYTRSRGYLGRYKNLVILRGVGLSILLFIAANFLFFRRTLAPRSTVLLFCCLAAPSVVLSRVAKALLLERFEIRRRHPRATRGASDLVLVLGGAGYIGSCLVRKLLSAGRKVRVMDSLVYGDDGIRELLEHPNFQLTIGDCRKIQDLVTAVKDVGAIIDLAAIVGDEACEVDRQTSLEINYAVTRMLIEVAKGNGIRRMVFASSCSVYGATDLLMDEFSATAPCSLYGQTKVDSEQALLHACSNMFHPSIVRIATVFGLSYRPRFDLVVNLLTARAQQEGLITIFNSAQWRPFIHVQDVAEGILQILNTSLEIVSGEVYNLGDSRMNFTLAQISEKIVAEFPSTRVQHVEHSDKRNYRVSFEKIRNQVGFQCRVSLEEGIHELHKAFEENTISDYTDARFHNQMVLNKSQIHSCKDELDTRVMAAFAQSPPIGRGQAPLLAKAVRGSR